MRVLQILLSFLLLCSIKTHAQSTKKLLDSLYNEIEFLIGDEWYFEPTQNGFKVTFCRSCKENFISYQNTTDFFSRELTREDFFQAELIDSICYYTNVSAFTDVSNLTHEEKNKFLAERYKANNILHFEVTFSNKWSKEKIETVISKNNQLKDSILREPLYKSNMGIFSDYRYWLPTDQWRKRTKGLNFYFERLPYKSILIDKSIFILHNKPFYFAIPMLVDKNDPEYFFKHENQLEDERRRSLKIIALALGIHDYIIVN